jgi:primosomal protein N''
MNNGNEAIKNEKKEKNYYERILKDLEIDKKNILARQELANNRIEVGKQLLLDLDRKTKGQDIFLINF